MFLLVPDKDLHIDPVVALDTAPTPLPPGAEKGVVVLLFFVLDQVFDHESKIQSTITTPLRTRYHLREC